MMKEVFNKRPEDLTNEDLQYLADAPLSVTKAYFETKELNDKLRKLRVRLPKIVTKKVQDRYLAQIGVLEADLNKIIKSTEEKLCK